MAAIREVQLAQGSSGSTSTGTGLRSIKAVMRDDHPTPIFLTLKRADRIAVQQILDRDHADGEHEKHMLSDHPSLACGASGPSRR
jgi:hypothetical protein